MTTTDFILGLMEVFLDITIRSRDKVNQRRALRRNIMPSFDLVQFAWKCKRTLFCASHRYLYKLTPNMLPLKPDLRLIDKSVELTQKFEQLLTSFTVSEIYKNPARS